jgi:hypothetical protein
MGQPGCKVLRFPECTVLTVEARALKTGQFILSLPSMVAEPGALRVGLVTTVVIRTE